MPPFSDREGVNNDRPEPQCKLCGGFGILTDDSGGCRPCPLCYFDTDVKESEKQMTVHEWIHQYLVNSGLWPAEADAVIEIIKSAPSCKPLSEVLSKSIDGYPQAFRAVAQLTVDSKALEWIDANKPKHFARPMFLLPSQRNKEISDEAS